MSTPPRLLIVTPSFHDYASAIAAAFSTQGFATRLCLYDRFATPAQKAWNKVRFELPEKFGKDTTAARAAQASARAIEAVRDSRPDVVLVIKGDVLHEAFWDALDDGGIPNVLWLYDELRRTRWDTDRLHRPGAVASYSSDDVSTLQAAGLDAMHVPLGFDHLLDIPAPTAGHHAEVTFIGARYPNRQALLEALAAAGTPVRAFGRDWSHALPDRVRTWGAERPDLPAGRDLARAAAYATMRDSLATLNVHGDQDGFTMRTFEAAGVGAVQLVDRTDVSQYYEPGSEVITFTGPDELVEQVQRLKSDYAAAASIRDAARSRTLAEHTLAHRTAQLAQGW